MNNFHIDWLAIGLVCVATALAALPMIVTLI